MCGIVGILNLQERPPVETRILRRMLQQIRHRGPDEFGIYRDPRVGMGSARLSILDIAGGSQPICDESANLWIVFNGEIFNHVELRTELETRGHRFTTQTDTEVIIHLYEEYGPRCLDFLNGQYAIAIWNAKEQSLFLARDRLGIRPLHYTVQNGQLLFGSEVKAFLGVPGFKLEIDAAALEEVFTYWSPLPPKTVFHGVLQVPAGHYLLVSGDGLSLYPYWELDFEEAPERGAASCLEELEALLIDATKIRLRADVPVGAYLSGGMDSSLVTALIRRHSNNPLNTFSISFSDPQYDESAFQKCMAKYLGTEHEEVFCTHEQIAEVFPAVIWHTEVPILRTSPAPMFLLSERVHDAGYKVVLTGEGADEMFAGYDIFKEMRVRRFWARNPSSQFRPALFQKIYRDIPGMVPNPQYLKAFFSRGLEAGLTPYYSHQIRWSNTRRITRFLNDGSSSPGEETEFPVPIPDRFYRWSHLAQAQYLEIVTFLTPYLLSSQGDRPAMAHAVEGRFPYLDHRVVEFCNRLPTRYKLVALQEKWLLRRLAERYIPEEIWARAKRPYRAPIQRSFLGADERFEYVSDRLSRTELDRTGYFKASAVGKLVEKARGADRISEVEEMALVGILSTQLLHARFIQDPPSISHADLAPMRLVEVDVIADA
jgi:asparagine synthase (glutamine-hydrolysing)